MERFSALPGISAVQLGKLASFFGIGTAVVSPGGIADPINGAWERLAGGRADWLVTVDATYRSGLEEALRQATVNGEAQLECRLTNGRWVHARVFRMTGGDGKLEALVVGISDITSLVEVREAHEQQLLAEKERLQEAMLSTVDALAAMEATRDLYTAGHQTRTGKLAAAVGEHLGLDRDTCTGLRLGAALHDVGKIGIPLEILTKPASLSATEYAVMREHSAKGHAILKEVKSSWPLARIAHEHHEFLDGTGYPQGLKSGRILLESQIAAVVDNVDAMTSHRPYRAGFTIDATLEKLSELRGKKLLPEAVDACVAVIESDRPRWATEHER